MKGADRSAIAVRRADGSINIKEEPLPPKKDWMRCVQTHGDGSLRIRMDTKNNKDIIIVKEFKK